MNKPVKKILVINLTRMGDILQSTPLLQALKFKYPDASIAYLVVTGFAEICQYIPEIDRIIPFDFNAAVAVSKEAVRYLPRRLSELRSFVSSLRGEKFDMVINLSHSRISALMALLIGVQHTRGLTLNSEGYRLIRHPWGRYFFIANLNRNYNRFNLVDVNQGFALNSGEFDSNDEPDQKPFGRWHLSFKLTPQAKAAADKIMANWPERNAPLKIGFQPGASLSCKRWPADSFRALGRLLRDSLGAGIVVFGTQKEADLAQAVCQPFGDAALNLSGKTDIGALGAVLSRMDLLITNDTGTQHLAAAVGTPVLSLCFGSALSHETGPYGKGHVIVESSLPCYPCSFHVECNRFRCQEQVTPEVVFHVAKMMLTNAPNRDAVIAAAEEKFKNVLVWRTDFDSDGFWILRPVIRRPLKTADFVNLCGRETWRKILTVPEAEFDLSCDSNLLGALLQDYLPPNRPGFRSEVEETRRALQRLAELAQAGVACCRILLETASSSGENIEAIASAGKKIEEIDKEITITGFRLPAVNHLVLDFNFVKQNLEGKGIVRLAQSTSVLYSRLHLIATKFNIMLESWPALFRELGWIESDAVLRDAPLPADLNAVRTEPDSGRFDQSVALEYNQL